jgi:hypothetical protein
VRGEPVTIVLDRSRGGFLTTTDKLLITLRHLYRFEVVRSIFLSDTCGLGGRGRIETAAATQILKHRSDLKLGLQHFD